MGPDGSAPTPLRGPYSTGARGTPRREAEARAGTWRGGAAEGCGAEGCGAAARVRGARRGARVVDAGERLHTDRQSTRLNSSHANISYAVFCLKKKTKIRM